ncbi:hypothetical protein EDC04DRAFT_2971916 [Pisolithus marmoratus]|nr:hypothetical protein EDC04DRAFT_2971916 [Pisolithus marmoratus]
MPFFTRLFGKSSSEDYEQILSTLAADVQKRQTRLAEIRLRERRTTLHFTLGTILMWFAYVSLWYTRTLPQTWRESGPGKAGGAGRTCTDFVCEADDADMTLMAVLKKQRAKVEEIKQKTNYYSTRNLIEKYDEPPASSTPNATPLRRRNVVGSVPPTPLTLQTQSPQQYTTPNGQTKSSVLQLSPAPQPIQATRKQWYDKLADAILGDDESSVGVAASRYALICQKCFAHNGLVKESQWEETQYICPKCGFFNPSAKSKKKSTSRTPSPPAMSTPSPARSVAQKPSAETPAQPLPEPHAVPEEAMEVDSK